MVLLQNMVGPGGVDDALEGETQSECERQYGKVARVVIYELAAGPGGGAVRDDEAVRIFVQFADAAGAARAVLDLHGRYFAKRRVRASFYDEARFARLDLGP